MNQQKSITITAFFIGLFIGIYFITLNVLGHSFNYFPGDLGDGRLNLYFLEHAHKFFLGEVDSFWDAPFMYPEKNVIAYSDNLLGTAPIYSFFRSLGFDNFRAYQWWFLMLNVLNYFTAFLLLKKLFKNPYVAVIGAMVFAFSMALQSQMTHVQMFPRFPIPLAFLALLYFKESFKIKHLFLAIFLVVYQIYCGVYLGFMLMVPIAILLILILFNHKKIVKEKIKISRWRNSFILSFIINGLILLPLMLPYMDRSRSPGIRTYFKILHNVPTLKSFFYSQKGSYFWDFLSAIGNDMTEFWNHQLFTGGLATISLIVFIIYFIKKRAKDKLNAKTDSLYLLFVCGLITFILFVRFDSFSAFISLYFLPGFTSIRALARIINIELIFFAIASSFTLSKIIKSSSWKGFPVFLVFVGIFLADNYFKDGSSYRTEVALAKERTAKLDSVFQKIPEGAIISYEPSYRDSPAFVYQIDAMLITQKYNLSCVNAYTGNSPNTYTNFWNNMNEMSRNEWFKSLNFSTDSLYVINSEKEVKLITAP